MNPKHVTYVEAAAGAPATSSYIFVVGSDDGIMVDLPVATVVAMLQADS
jgi:hypothetical protein